MPKWRNLVWLSLCMMTLIFLTSHQRRKSAITLTLSSCLSTLTYTILHKSRLFHPKPGVLTPALESEWQSRIVASMNATILTIGSLLCFHDWKNLSHEDAWAIHSTTDDTEHNGEFYPAFFAAIFGGFLQYDLCWIIYHIGEDYDDASALIHHVLFLAVTHYNLRMKFFLRPFAWLILAELSTPFLHLRWYMAVTNQKGSPWYTFFSAMFAVTFLVTRVMGYTWGLWDMWWQGSHFWIHSPVGAYYVVAAIHLGYALNLFWGVKVVTALVKVVTNIKGPAHKDTSAATTDEHKNKNKVM